jgi:Calcineurin-like phosphoesterase superfamily domain
MKVAVFADVHAHAQALEAVLAAADRAGVDERWSLGDMFGTGLDAVRVATLVRASCALAMCGNHDLAVTGSIDPARFGPPGSAGVLSLELAGAALAAAGLLDWVRGLKPARRRAGVQCWHASPRDPVREYVGPANAAACLARQRAPIGLVGHTHVAAAWHETPAGAVRAVPVAVDRPLALSAGKWLLNPGAVGATLPARGTWAAALERHARLGASWLELDLEARVATWRRAPLSPAGADAQRRSGASGVAGTVAV